MESYDFSGWATRNNVECSDGRTILRDAFKHNDGQTVPLVWNHQHNDPDNVVGHVLLENRPEGVYAYGSFNNSPKAQHVKESVIHGDITGLSIYANKLKQKGGNVLHGAIREVSLVLAGANPGAFIDSVMGHGDDFDEEAIIYTGEEISLAHAEEESEKEEEPMNDEEKVIVEDEEAAVEDEDVEEVEEDEELEHADGEKTVGEIFETLNEEQKSAVYAIVGNLLESQETEGDEVEMKHNVFENEENMDNTLSHAEMDTIISDAKRFGSMRESYLAHADEYGIEDIEWLFPEDRNLNVPPQFIQREMSWVDDVMSSVSHSPFSRIKSMFADITEDAARAKGYIKGKLKKEEVFSLLKRSTQPTTVYKKQKIDRDDTIDITDFDVVSWIKGEMRTMLNEELARAYLLGDGRLSSDDDKIDENCIRPVVNDHDLFVIRWSVAAGADASAKAKNFETAAIKARKNYKGSGNPTLYTTEDMLTDMLLREDTIGHKLYKTEAELATALRVKKIVTVPVLEGFQDKDNKDVYGIIVNLSDYKVGADKGGSINMFEDFDIDYNQMKYLMETRCSGSLVKPFSAIVLRSGSSTASEEPTLAQAKAALNN